MQWRTHYFAIEVAEFQNSNTLIHVLYVAPEAIFFFLCGNVHPRQIIITNLKAFEDYVCFNLFILLFSIFIKQELYKRQLVEMGLILIYSSNGR